MVLGKNYEIEIAGRKNRNSQNQELLKHFLPARQQYVHIASVRPLTNVTVHAERWHKSANQILRYSLKRVQRCISHDFVFFAYKKEKAFQSVAIQFLSQRNVRFGFYEAYKLALSISTCECTGAQYGKYAEKFTDDSTTTTQAHNQCLERDFQLTILLC